MPPDSKTTLGEQICRQRPVTNAACNATQCSGLHGHHRAWYLCGTMQAFCLSMMVCIGNPSSCFLNPVPKYCPCSCICKCCSVCAGEGSKGSDCLSLSQLELIRRVSSCHTWLMLFIAKAAFLSRGSAMRGLHTCQARNPHTLRVHIYAQTHLPWSAQSTTAHSKSLSEGS